MLKLRDWAITLIPSAPPQIIIPEYLGLEGGYIIGPCIGQGSLDFAKLNIILKRQAGDVEDIINRRLPQIQLEDINDSLRRAYQAQQRYLHMKPAAGSCPFKVVLTFADPSSQLFMLLYILGH